MSHLLRRFSISRVQMNVFCQGNLILCSCYWQALSYYSLLFNYNIFYSSKSFLSVDRNRFYTKTQAKKQLKNDSIGAGLERKHQRLRFEFQCVNVQKKPCDFSYFARSSRSQMFCNFIKKRLQQRCFPVNIAKFIEHVCWPLLFCTFFFCSMLQHFKLLDLYHKHQKMYSGFILNGIKCFQLYLTSPLSVIQ